MTESDSTKIKNLVITAMRAKELMDFSEINNELEMLSMDESTTILASYLRVTCAFKSQLPYWPTLFQNVRDELEHRELCWPIILRGLY